MTPKARINYELEQLRHDIATRNRNAQGLNEWTPEQLVKMDQDLRQRIAFIGTHPLFSEICSDGRRDDWVQSFWEKMEEISVGWVGTIREVDCGHCRAIQEAMGRAKVD